MQRRGAEFYTKMDADVVAQSNDQDQTAKSRNQTEEQKWPRTKTLKTTRKNESDPENKEKQWPAAPKNDEPSAKLKLVPESGYFDKKLGFQNQSKFRPVEAHPG